MQIETLTLWTQKQGSSEEEYEDAAWPLEPVSMEAERFSCAIADGASESSFARDWARILVEGLSTGRALEKMKDEWQRGIQGRDLPWYAEQKAITGAFAAILHLHLESADSGTGGAWWAGAVGDCCLFHMRDNRLLASHPLRFPEQFDNSPALISSVNPDQPPELKVEGTWRSGDSFILASDALALWALERRSTRLERLLRLVTQDELKELAEAERLERKSDGRMAMRNDDVTFLKLEVVN